MQIKLNSSLLSLSCGCHLPTAYALLGFEQNKEIYKNKGKREWVLVGEVNRTFIDWLWPVGLVKSEDVEGEMAVSPTTSLMLLRLFGGVLQF